MSQRLPATARREQILDVALDVFAASGFHGASMNDVAEAAGVTKPVLYQHFDSKRDLYKALLDEVGNRLLDSIAKATAEATDGKSQTELGFRAYFRWVSDDHAGFRLLFGSGTSNDDEFAAAVAKITARGSERDRAADRGRHLGVDAPDAGARPRRHGRRRQPPTGRAGRRLRPGSDRHRGLHPRLGRPPRPLIRPAP